MEDTGGGIAYYAPRWGEAEEAALRYYWKRKEPASEIAHKLERLHGFTVTRNGVIGKANRLGLKPRVRKNGGGKKPKPTKPTTATRPAREIARKPKQPVPVAVLDAVFVAPDSLPKDIWAIGYGECRYIVDSGKIGGLYCAAPTTDGSWCRYHERIVYRSST